MNVQIWSAVQTILASWVISASPLRTSKPNITVSITLLCYFFKHPFFNDSVLIRVRQPGAKLIVWTASTRPAYLRSRQPR